MKALTLSSALALLGVLTVPSAHAAVSFSASDSTPPLGGDGIGSTSFNNTDRQQQDYTDNANQAAGQTFTTGANAAGYLLDSFSFATQDTNVGNGTSFTVTLRTISGATAGLVQTFTATSSLSVGRSPYSGTDVASWYTFSFSGADRISIVANTLYGIDVSQSGGWSGLGRSSTAYAGGNSYYINTSTGTVTQEAGRADAAFVVGLTAAASAVPEPSACAALAGLAALGLAVGRRRPV